MHPMTTKPPAAKKQPGRPATGRTPDSIRTARSAENLRLAGGKPNVRFNLQPEGVQHLKAIQVAQGLSQTEALHWALATAVKRLPKG